MKTSSLFVMSLFITLFGAGLAAHEPPPDPSLAAPEHEPGILAPSTASKRPERAWNTPESRRAIEPYGAAVSGTPLYTRVATNNTRHEIETAITAVTKDNVDHTAGAYMREVNGVFRINTISSTTPASTSLSHWVRQTPGLPSNHHESVDPVLDVNPYTSGEGTTRIYLGGLTYGLDAFNNRTAPQAIVVWQSDDGGQTWLMPVTVDSNPLSSPVLDKPDLAVSWYILSRGYVYVAYLKVITSRTAYLNQLWVARSTDGGATFPLKFQLATGHIHAPQVVVSSNTGKVYVIWVDHDAQQIKMTSSPYNFFSATSWTAQPSLNGVGRFLTPCEFKLTSQTVECDPIAAPGASSCPDGLQAVTVPQARYNSIKDQIGLVWHERETNSPTATTDVFFSAFGTSGWLTPKRVNPTQARDQWYPALDYDSTGEYLVVFYDRSQDPSNLLYREAWARLNSSGTRLSSGFVADVFDSDPSEVFTTGNLCFKGEYQDIWFWPYTDTNGPRFHALWTGHPESATNVDDEVQLSAVK